MGRKGREREKEEQTKDTCMGPKIYREIGSEPMRDEGVRRENRGEGRGGRKEKDGKECRGDEPSGREARNRPGKQEPKAARVRRQREESSCDRKSRAPRIIPHGVTAGPSSGPYTPPPHR